MNHDRRPTESADWLPGDLSAAARLRAMADGELPAGQSDRELGSIDGLDARLGFERELRGVVARVMGDTPSAPPELRARIQAMLGADRAESELDRARVHEPSPRHIPAPTRRHHLMRRVAGLSATLAVLALCGTLVFISAQRSGVLSTGGPAPALPLAQSPVKPLDNSAAPVIARASLLDDSVTRFVGEEHDRCDDFGQHFNKKFSRSSADQLLVSSNELFQKIPLSVTTRIRQLEDAGYCFAGFGVCGLPGRDGPAAHLIFRNARAGASVSVFIRRDECKAAKPDTSCCDRADQVGSCNGSLLAWQDDAFDYYLYACDPSGLAVAKDAFGLPPELRREHD